MKEPIEINFETLAVANMMLTKHLLYFVTSKHLLDDEEIQAVLSRTINDMTRSTLPISDEGAKQVLRLMLAGTGLSESYLI